MTLDATPSSSLSNPRQAFVFTSEALGINKWVDPQTFNLLQDLRGKGHTILLAYHRKADNEETAIRLLNKGLLTDIVAISPDIKPKIFLRMIRLLTAEIPENQVLCADNNSARIEMLRSHGFSTSITKIVPHNWDGKGEEPKEAQKYRRAFTILANTINNHLKRTIETTQPVENALSPNPGDAQNAASNLLVNHVSVVDKTGEAVSPERSPPISVTEEIPNPETWGQEDDPSGEADETPAPVNDPFIREKRVWEKTITKQSKLVVIESSVLFGNGHVDQPDNFNASNLNILSLIKKNGGQVLLIPPQEADNQAAFALNEKIAANYIMRAQPDVAAARYISNILDMTLSKKEQVLYIGSDRTYIDALDGIVNAVHVRPIPPQQMVSDNMDDIEVRVSQKQLDVLTDKISAHLGLFEL